MSAPRKNLLLVVYLVLVLLICLILFTNKITHRHRMNLVQLPSTNSQYQSTALQQVKLLTSGEPIVNKTRNTNNHTAYIGPTKAARPIIYVITPTYNRRTQPPDLTRLAQTLMNVKSLHWIVIEDSPCRTSFVQDLLQRYGLNYTHLNTTSSERDKKRRIRGCAQRNAGLKWIKNNTKDGIIYFADDDNAYDIRLFDEIRYTKKVGLMPTGNFKKAGFSTPIVKHGKVVGFVDSWMGRKFPVDMASMSINITFWLKSGAPMLSNKTAGYMESKLLESLKISKADIEPKANNCTTILVWHTRTLANHPSPNYTLPANTSDSNLLQLLGRNVLK